MDGRHNDVNRAQPGLFDVSHQGILITARRAFIGWSKGSNEPKQRPPPKLGALVYVAALLPDKGEASGQVMSKFAAPNDAMRVSTNRATPDHKYFYIPPAKFRETYAADVPAPDAQFMADSEQQLAQKAMGAPLSVAAWHNKPSFAILTTQDRVVSPELQRWMYKRSGAKVTEVSASHAVFVSQPAAVAQVIEAAAKQEN